MLHYDKPTTTFLRPIYAWYINSCMSCMSCIAISLAFLIVNNFPISHASEPTSLQESYKTSSAKALHWLKRINQHAGQLRFEGHFSHIIADDIRLIRYLHANFDNIPYERITQLNGLKAEIIRKGDQLICVLPGKDPAYLYKTDQPTPFGRQYQNIDAQVAELYQFKTHSQARIAGYDTLYISAHPKDAHRFHYQFWLEPKTSLLIKSVISDQQGKKLEHFEFSDFKVNSMLTKQDFEIISQNSQTHLMHDPMPQGPAKPLDFSWQLHWMPQGFRFAATQQHITSSSSALASLSMKLFTDGIASFSIFIEPVSEDAKAPPISQHGATLFISKLIDTSQHARHPRHQVTLVGDIPLTSGTRILNAINIHHPVLPE